MKMLSDNKTSLTLIRDPESQNYIKHINVIHHHVQEFVENRELATKWISNSNMLADSLIKVFLAGSFKKH